MNEKEKRESKDDGNYHIKWEEKKEQQMRKDGVLKKDPKEPKSDVDKLRECVL